MKRTALVNLAIALLAALFFIPGLGVVRLFDWDEINFAESTREMLATGDWFNVRINSQSFWEKPPLFIWAQALSMKVFGVNEFAARLPNALIGIVTLLVLFNIGRKRENERLGILWAMMYGISFLPFFYFKSGIIDPWFNLFIFLGIYFFSRYAAPGAEAMRMRHAALSALFTALAILTKGPVAFLIFVLTFAVWLVARRFRFTFRWKDVAVYFAVLLLAGGSWFILLAATGHSDVISDFINYQIRLFRTKDAGHGGFLLYHFVILLFGVAPASVFALSTFRRSNVRNDSLWQNDPLPGWMMCSLWVVLILFTIVRTKIVHYSSFCYFPISFLAAFAASRMLDGKLRLRRYQRILLTGTAAAFALVLLLITTFDLYKDRLVPFVHDPFAVSCMAASSDWIGFEPFAGLVLLGATIAFCAAFRKKPLARHFTVLSAGNLLFAITSILCVVPQVEKYSQASAVDFYIARQGEDCYVQPAYFKSYAQYFYTNREPGNNCDDFEWLCRGPIDKPCYFVVKDIPRDVQRLRDDAPEAELLYGGPGFLFFVRQNGLEPAQEQDGQGEQESVPQDGEKDVDLVVAGDER